MDYEKAWKQLYRKLKILSEIKDFHGLSYKRPVELLVTTVLKWMDELESDCINHKGGDAE